MGRLLIGIVLIVVAIEFGLRGYEFYTGDIIPEARRITFAEEVSLLGMPHSETHPFLGYTYPKNLEGKVRRYTMEPVELTIETNSQGFRTHEFYPKLPFQYRILLLGDSFIGGNNANQSETPAAVLEGLMRQRIGPHVEVLSLGVPSYSGVLYAVLTRLYIDVLDPDMLIVAVDQSDFDEDRMRIQAYETDAAGVPLHRKDAAAILREKQRYLIMIDEERRQQKVEVSERLVKLRAASSTVNVLFRMLEGIAAESRRIREGRVLAAVEKKAERVPSFSFSELGPDERADWTERIPPRLAGDSITVDLATARERYQPTLASLRYIADACAQRDVHLFLASYPYPWNVSRTESLPYQVRYLKGVFDLRENRVHPQLMDEYADALGVPHLNAYPVFEADADGKYGRFDQHFNAAGYSQLARFLFDSTAETVRAGSAGLPTPPGRRRPR